jgi:hypothetical protein
MGTLKNIIKARKNPVILDRRDRFIYFPNSKVAQRSIVRNLLKDRVIVRKDDPEAWDARFDALNEDYFTNTFKFTIVRNPYDRVVSAFSYLTEKCQGYELHDFVTDVLATQGVAFDPHFDEQSEGLFHDGALLVDYVGRFEAIDESWQQIAARIDAPPRLPHQGRSRRERSYAGYYRPESRQVVERLYGDDLRNFGYTFEDEQPASASGFAGWVDWLRRRASGQPR